MKVRKKSRGVQELVGSLSRQGSGKGSGTWKAVAGGLNRPRRARNEVNLFMLEKNARSRETIVVPGIVLGSGEIRKPLTIAALRFSGKAREKIEKAGGKCISIEELFENRPKGEKIRIMG
jgi:large subunit ribosomal protein L18e